MKKLSVVLLLSLLVLVGLSSKNINDIFPALEDGQVKQLLSGEMLHTSSAKEDIRYLIPKDSLIENEVEEVLSYKKGFTVAVGVYLPFPSSYSNLSKEEILLDIYNKCLTVSTMKGLTYISHRAGDKEKVLFEDASMLSSSSSKDRIEDPVVTEIPPYAERFALMKDTSFGNNVYRVEYVAEGNQIAMKMKNSSEFKFMGIGLVAKGKVTLLLDINVLDEGIVFSGVAAVKDKTPTVNLVFYKVDLEESILNRIIALKNWFIAKMEG